LYILEDVTDNQQDEQKDMIVQGSSRKNVRNIYNNKYLKEQKAIHLVVTIINELEPSSGNETTKRNHISISCNYIFSLLH